MKTLAILSQKGGVGKSTLAINIGVASELSGKETLIIDTDPQASVSAWSDIRGNEKGPVVMSGHASRLKQALEQVAEVQPDLVIIDTAPHAQNDAMQAAAVADLVLIPAEPNFFSLSAIQATVNIVRLGNVPHGVVINKIKHFSQKGLGEQAREFIIENKLKLVPVSVIDRMAFVHAVTEGQGVHEYEPGGPAAHEIDRLFSWIQQEINL
jgi:chromosome partitioning protein